MSAHQPSTATLQAQRAPRWYTGRGELGVAAAVLLLAGAIAYGTITMEVPEGVSTPGPQFFPTLVAVFLGVVGVALAVEVLRSSRRTHVESTPTEVSSGMLEDLGALDETREIRVVDPGSAPTEETPAGIDWRTVGILVAAIAGFILILMPVGWLLSAAALFWVVAFALGSRRPVFDIAVSVLVSSLIQLAFSAGLGLTLPGGIMQGALSWIH